MKVYLSIFLIALLAVQSIAAQEVVYSFSEARTRMLRESDALKVADAEVRMARNEQAKAASWWWPRLQADGMYAHLSEKIEVRQTLSQFTDPAKAYIHSILPSEQLLSGLLDEVGKYTLTFPLLPQDVAAVGLTAEWVVFAGGKRIFADRLSRRLVDMAQTDGRQIRADEQILLVKRYYGLALAQQTIQVCEERCQGAVMHYEHTRRLEAEGMVDRAARLLAQVNVREAERELERAHSAERAGQVALKELLRMADDSVRVIPSSPLFMNEHLPLERTFQESMRVGNPTLGTLYIEESIADDKLRIDQSAYLPNVALFGKQTLYAHGLPSNLLPRTVIGVGFTWNLFDGLERERQIAQSRIAKQQVIWSRHELEGELSVAVSELYATLQRAREDVDVLNGTIALNEELLRMRKVAFSEGMATSAEVVDAVNVLAETRLARLAAYYAYDVALASMLAMCGVVEQWDKYIE